MLGEVADVAALGVEVRADKPAGRSAGPLETAIAHDVQVVADAVAALDTDEKVLDEVDWAAVAFLAAVAACGHVGRKDSLAVAAFVDSVLPQVGYYPNCYR